MNFAIEDSPEQSAFRAEVREFFSRNVSPQLEHAVDPCDMSYEQYQLRRDLGRRLGAKGWLYPSMPQEYGGGDLSAENVAILHDELARIQLALPPYYDAGGACRRRPSSCGVRPSTRSASCRRSAGVKCARGNC